MQIPSPSCSAGCRGSHSSVLFGRDLEVACVPPSEEGARRRRLLPGVGTTHRVGAKPPAWGLVRGRPAVRPAAALGHREAPGRAVPCPPSPPSPFSPPPAPGGSGLQPELLRVPVAPCRGVGRLRCARWPRSGGRGPSEPVRNCHVIRLVTDTTQGAGKRERGPQSRATSSAVRRGRARRGALHPRLLQLGSPSATRSRRFGFLTFLPRHSIIVFPGR